MNLGFPMARSYTVYTRAGETGAARMLGHQFSIDSRLHKNPERVMLQVKCYDFKFIRSKNINNAPARHIWNKEFASRYAAWKQNCKLQACTREVFNDVSYIWKKVDCLANIIIPLFLQTQTWAESDNIDPRHPTDMAFIKSQRSRVMTSYLRPYISGRARKFTTNALSSKSNDDSVGRICYNGCNERLVRNQKHLNKTRSLPAIRSPTLSAFTFNHYLNTLA